MTDTEYACFLIGTLQKKWWFDITVMFAFLNKTFCNHNNRELTNPFEREQLHISMTFSCFQVTNYFLRIQNFRITKYRKEFAIPPFTAEKSVFSCLVNKPFSTSFPSKSGVSQKKSKLKQTVLSHKTKSSSKKQNLVYDKSFNSSSVMLNNKVFNRFQKTIHLKKLLLVNKAVGLLPSHTILPVNRQN